MVIYRNNCSFLKQIYSFRTLNCSTMEKITVIWNKLWHFGKNYDTITKTMEI